jgi:hypothetical protein
MVNENLQRVMIQIDNPKQDFSGLVQFFAGFGVELDKDYGIVPINPSIKRFLIRGWATSKAIESIRHQAGIKVFADPHIGHNTTSNQEAGHL